MIGRTLLGRLISTELIGPDELASGTRNKVQIEEDRGLVCFLLTVQPQLVHVEIETSRAAGVELPWLGLGGNDVRAAKQRAYEGFVFLPFHEPEGKPPSSEISEDR